MLLKQSVGVHSANTICTGDRDMSDWIAVNKISGFVSHKERVTCC
jgi:hypothetical protein